VTPNEKLRGALERMAAEMRNHGISLAPHIQQRERWAEQIDAMLAEGALPSTARAEGEHGLGREGGVQEGELGRGIGDVGASGGLQRGC